MKAADYSIAEVVPHAGAMSLLATIEDGGEDWLQTRARIEADNLFVDDLNPAGVPAWVGIEYMAQTVAAWAGVQARQRGEPVSIGYLVGSRRYDTDTSVFAVGSELQIRVQQLLAGDNGLGAFECRLQAVTAAGQSFSASATLNVYQPRDSGDLSGNDDAAGDNP